MAVFNQNIPAFIFNEFEVRQRYTYLLGEGVRANVDEQIEIRTGRKETYVNEKDMQVLGTSIERGLRDQEELLTEHTKYSRWQSWIPFLPEKYKDYLRQKEEAFVNYREAIRLFSELKENEHKIYNAFLALSKIPDIALVIENLEPDEQWQYLSDLENLLEGATQDVRTLRERGFVTQDLAFYLEQRLVGGKAILTTITSDDDLETQLEKIKEEGDRIAANDQDISVLISQWQSQIVDKKRDEWIKFDDISFEQANKANEYYRSHNLGNDMITKLLSKISDRFPRNI